MPFLSLRRGDQGRADGPCFPQKRRVGPCVPRRMRSPTQDDGTRHVGVVDKGPFPAAIQKYERSLIEHDLAMALGDVRVLMAVETNLAA